MEGDGQRLSRCGLSDPRQKAVYFHAGFVLKYISGPPQTVFFFFFCI